jgi:hypothetical protein
LTFTHVVESPEPEVVYPPPHEHMYPPEVLVQLPYPRLALHVDVEAHSLTSTHVAMRPLPEAVKPAPQVQL